jgi:hypothetical protein
MSLLTWMPDPRGGVAGLKPFIDTWMKEDSGKGMNWEAARSAAIPNPGTLLDLERDAGRKVMSSEFITMSDASAP